MMRIRMITPAPAHSRQGNRVSALRWARFLRQLGHRVKLAQQYRDEECDLLLALHARRSHRSIARYRELHPEGPLIVALTGTDVYRDIHENMEARVSLRLADRMIVLQPMALNELAPWHQRKTRVIRQSVPAPRSPPPRIKRWFAVTVVGHLRPVKDPFVTAEAARLLPPASRIRVHHLGQALEAPMEKRARREMAENPRYHWLGERPRWQARRRMARSHLLVLSSKMEGGANVISEAIVAGTPVLASRISGSVGLLGEDYPGYFPVGDARALAALLTRAEREPAFLAALGEHVRALAPLFAPERERDALAALLAEVTG